MSSTAGPNRTSNWQTEQQSEPDATPGRGGWLNRWRGTLDNSPSVMALNHMRFGTAEDGTVGISRRVEGRWVTVVMPPDGVVEVKHGRTRADADDAPPMVVVNRPVPAP